MDLRTIEVGTRLQLLNGATVVVIKRSDNASLVRVRYLESPVEPDREGAVGDVPAALVYGAFADDNQTELQQL